MKEEDGAGRADATEPPKAENPLIGFEEVAEVVGSLSRGMSRYPGTYDLKRDQVQILQ
jgi:hypothetical protein